MNTPPPNAALLAKLHHAQAVNRDSENISTADVIADAIRTITAWNTRAPDTLRERVMGLQRYYVTAYSGQIKHQDGEYIRYDELETIMQGESDV